MTPSAKKPRPQSAAAIAAALGPCQPLWDDLRHQLDRDFAPLTNEWVFGGQKHGWALRLKRRDRAMLYLKPLDQHFRVSLVLGPKAVGAARGRKLPAYVLRLVDSATKYPEGWAIRFEVHDSRDVRTAMQLATIKLERTAGPQE